MKNLKNNKKNYLKIAKIGKKILIKYFKSKFSNFFLKL